MRGVVRMVLEREPSRPGRGQRAAGGRAPGQNATSSDLVAEHTEMRVTSGPTLEDGSVVCTLIQSKSTIPTATTKNPDNFNSRENLIVRERKCNDGILQSSAENSIYIVLKIEALT